MNEPNVILMQPYLTEDNIENYREFVAKLSVMFSRKIQEGHNEFDVVNDYIENSMMLPNSSAPHHLLRIVGVLAYELVSLKLAIKKEKLAEMESNK